MTCDDAIATFRRLQAEADEEWPYEYDRVKVGQEAEMARAAIVVHVEKAEDPLQEAKAVLHRIQRTEAFKPTVPTKRERARQGAV